MKSRNMQLDCLRIVCSVFVIGIHILMNYRMKSLDIPNYGVIFIESFFRCAVPCFILLSGYFLFQKDMGLFELFKRLLFKIVFPLLLMCVAIVFYNGFTLEALYNTIINFFAWELPEPGFWLGFMRTLIKLYLMYPILKYICIDRKDTNEVRWYILTACLVAQFILPMISQFIPQVQSKIYIYWPVELYGFIYFVLGYEIYRFQKINYFSKRILAISGGIIYLGSSISTFLLTIFYDIAKYGEFTQIFYGYTSINIAFSAIGLMILFLNISINVKVPFRIKKIIEYISNRTLIIFLVHYLVIVELLDSRISRFFYRNLSEYLYYFIMIILSCIISLTLAIIINIVAVLFGKLMKMVRI